MHEEIIENRLEDAFQFDHSYPLVCEEANLSNQPFSSIETDTSFTDIQSSSCKANSQHQNSAQRKFTLRLRYLVCTLRHCGSDDPDKCPFRGDAFRPDWMSMRIRKHNADYDPSPKKQLNFRPLLPMAPVITKSKLQSNEANAQFVNDNETLPIAVTNNNDHFEGNVFGNEVV